MSTDIKLNTVLVVLVLWCLPLDSAVEVDAVLEIR